LRFVVDVLTTNNDRNKLHVDRSINRHHCHVHVHVHVDLPFVVAVIVIMTAFAIASA